jgi:hypothetical protein
MTITILWYALHGHHPDDVADRREAAPWYQSKTNPSFTDMLANQAPTRDRRPTIFTRTAHRPPPTENAEYPAGIGRNARLEGQSRG